MERNEKENMGGYDSDQEPHQPNLSWRMNQEESLSDWCIRIAFVEEASGEKHIDEYHVHKSILAAGARKSDYFCSLFKNNFAEQQTAKSNIDLPELVAKAFPAFLDYIYACDDALEINTENATSLYHLSQYFGVERLRWKAKQFWTEDMRSGTCGTYIEHAIILNEHKVTVAALETCCANILKIDTSSRLVHVNDPDVWCPLLRRHTHFSFDVKAMHLSVLLSALLRNVDMDPENFKRLTSKDLLPCVVCDAALPLLDAERRIVDPAGNEATCLQKRCVIGLADNWTSMSSEKIDHIKRYHTPVLAEIIVHLTEESTRRKEKLATYARELHRFRRVPRRSSCVDGGTTDRSDLPQMPFFNAPSEGMEMHLFNEVDGSFERDAPLFYYDKLY